MRVIVEEKHQTGVVKVNKKSSVPDDLNPISMRATNHQPSNYTTVKPKHGIALNIGAYSDDETSDGESCYNSDETDCLENNINEPDSSGELTSKLCNLSVSEDNEDVIARSPIYATQHTSRSEPYSLDCRKRNNFLQNGGQMFEINPTVNLFNQTNTPTNKKITINLPRFDILQSTDHENRQMREEDLKYQANRLEQYSQNNRNITNFNIEPSADLLQCMPISSETYQQLDAVAGYLNDICTEQQYYISATNIQPPTNNVQCPSITISQQFDSVTAGNVDLMNHHLNIPVRQQSSQNLDLNMQVQKSQPLDVLDAICEQDLGYSVFKEPRKEADKNSEVMKNFDLSFLEDIASWSEDSTYGSVANSPLQAWSPQYSDTGCRTDNTSCDIYYENQDPINQTVMSDNTSTDLNILNPSQKDTNQDDLELISQLMSEIVPEDLLSTLYSLDFGDVCIDDSTLKSDDSTYGSCANSPSQALSPYSASLSGSPRYQYAPVTDVNTSITCSENCDTNNLKSLATDNAVKVTQNIPQTNINLNVDQLTSAVKQNIPSSNIGLSKSNESMRKESAQLDSAYRRTEKQIRPMGVVVYDNPQAASERLNEMVNPKKLPNQKKLNYFYNVQFIKVSLGTNGDPEVLKTNLFKFLTEKRMETNDRWLSVLFAHIEYLVGMATSESSSNKEKFAEILSSKEDGMSLLYIACTKHADLPIAARYIAEKMVKLERNVNEAYNHCEGNSLIHYLAERGDTHVKLLAELMQVKNGIVAAFDINHRNVNSQTPLHLAVIAHSTSKICFATIKHLVDHGAKMFKDVWGRTPLDYALFKHCEPNIIQKLLNAAAVVNIQDCKVTTSLDLAYNNQKKGNVVPLLETNAVHLKAPNKGSHLASQ